MSLKALVYSGVLIVLLLLSYSTVFLFDKETVLALTREDRFFESLTAIFFLLASILFFILFLRHKPGNDFHFFHTGKNIFFLFLAIILFVGSGEEISWGQRIFNWQTPEALKEINIQKETNIHNIEIFHGLNAEGERKSFWGLLLNIDRLFSLFWLIFCLVIPILDKTLIHFSNWLKKINLPIVSLWIGVCFIINYLISKLSEFYTSSDLDIVKSITEIKECNIALLFVVVSIWFLIDYNSKKRNEYIAAESNPL